MAAWAAVASLAFDFATCQSMEGRGVFGKAGVVSCFIAASLISSAAFPQEIGEKPPGPQPSAKPTTAPLAVVIPPPIVNENATVQLGGQSFKAYPTPQDWTGWAIADLFNIPELDRPFIRYLAIPGWGNEQWWPAANFMLNTSISHSRVIRNAVPIANGWMLRVNLRELVPQPDRLAKTIAVWDGLANKDPYNHIPDVNLDGKVVVIAPAIPPEQAELLASMTLSPGAVYRLDWFMGKALQTLNKGQYYEFRQVVLGNDSAASQDASASGEGRQKSANATSSPAGQTQVDKWLSDRGVFVATTEKSGGERRAGMFRSGVTGKARRVDLFPSLAGGLGSITRDIVDETEAADAHPIQSLLKFRDDGAEIIVALPNGLHDYVLANGKGEIIREAPPNLVHDTTIPAPHTKRLQPGLSCISCHCIDREDGWRAVTNDVKDLVESGLNVFGDFSDQNLTQEEAFDLLAGFYALDIEEADFMLARARRDYSKAVAKCAAGVKFSAEKSIVEQVGQLVTSIVHTYDYDLVTPQVAAREIGYQVPDEFQGNPIPLILGDIPSDQEIHLFVGALYKGKGINRKDFERVYQDMLLLAQLNQKRQAEAGK